MSIPGRRALTVTVAVCALVLAMISPAWAATRTIVWLGDSVASGYKLALVDNPSPLDRLCERSKQAPVYEAAAVTGMQPALFACPGAWTWNVVADQDKGGQDVPPQYQQAKAALAEAPYAGVVTAGPNDLDWETTLLGCVGALRCDTEANTSLFHARLRLAEAGMFSALVALGTLHPRWRVATGYYDPFEGNLVTPGDLGIDQDEVAWYKARLHDLNEMIKRTVKRFRNGIYAAIDFSGQAGQLVQAPWEAGRFHPTALGAKLIGRQTAAVIPG